MHHSRMKSCMRHGHGWSRCIPTSAAGRPWRQVDTSLRWKSRRRLPPISARSFGSSVDTYRHLLSLFDTLCRSRVFPFVSSEGEGNMQYLLLIYEEEARFANLDKEAFNKELAAYQGFGREFANSIRGSNALQPTSTAKTVRLRNGKRLTTDGPSAETKEQLGGYFLVEAADLDEALTMAERIPGARFGSIEVRPIMTFS